MNIVYKELFKNYEMFKPASRAKHLVLQNKVRHKT